jgi:hypothetical protein
LKVYQDLMEHKAHRDYKVLQVLQVLWVWMVQWGHKALKDKQEHRVL